MMTSKQQLYQLLELQSPASPASTLVNRSLIFLIVLSVLTVTAETIPDVASQYHQLFYYLEFGFASIFATEYFLRLWIASEHPKGRLGYALSAEAIIDLMSFLPFILSIVLDWDFKTLVMLRLLRLFKLARYIEPLRILGRALKAELPAFTSALFVLCILMLIAASGMYILERDAQPGFFGSIPQSMWWSIVTLTTLGYGDVVPVTIGGKIFASVITLLSIGTVALPAGILASRFSEELRQRKNNFRDMAFQLQENGDLCEKSRISLEQERQKLSLCEREADAIIRQACSTAPSLCPRCKNELEEDL
jgi:voltage-gated potassium channel